MLRRIMMMVTGLCLSSVPCGMALAAPVSVQAVDCNVRDVLLGMAMQGDTAVILDDSVEGKITLLLDNVEFSEALALIAKVKGLQYLQKHDNVYLISRNLTDLSMAHVIPVVNLPAQQALDDARTLLGLSGEEAARCLSFDKTANQLIYFGDAATAESLKRQFKQLDQKPVQVMLEAKVLSIENSASKKLGIEWEWSKLPLTPERETAEITRRISVWNAASGQYENLYETVPTEKVSRKYKGSSEIPGIIKLGHGYEAYYAATLDALVGRGKAEVLAKPNVAALDGHEAQINIGGSVPIPTVTNTNTATTTALTYHDVGIILRYTPHVRTDGELTADVHIEVSSPVFVEAMQAYKFNKRTVDTTVRLLDGETMVIGGLIGTQESENMSRVPFLSDIPILGKFFQHKDKSHLNSELVIFLKANKVI